MVFLAQGQQGSRKFFLHVRDLLLVISLILYLSAFMTKDRMLVLMITFGLLDSGFGAEELVCPTSSQKWSSAGNGIALIQRKKLVDSIVISPQEEKASDAALANSTQLLQVDGVGEGTSESTLHLVQSFVFRQVAAIPTWEAKWYQKSSKNDVKSEQPWDITHIVLHVLQLVIFCVATFLVYKWNQEFVTQGMQPTCGIRTICCCIFCSIFACCFPFDPPVEQK